jgi:bifunctional non-homologous end joining protein LigD
VRDPNAKPPVEDPPQKPRKKPMRDPVDQGVAALTHPDRVLYPEQGTTKLDLARYLAKVAEPLLAHAAGRPLMLKRCPEGYRGTCFFQKHPSGPVPASFGTVRIRERTKTEDYLLLRNAEGLMELAQRSVLEIHVWGARAEALERPDRVVFDFDPHESTPWAHVVDAALRMRDLLRELDLESFVKTTGGGGLHVVVPTRKGPTWDDVKDFSAALASTLVREEPDRYTLHLPKARRGTRMFIDTLRNRRGATWIAPYSPRAREGAPVSMPLEWRDVSKRLSPRAFSIRALLQRPRLSRDAWAGIDNVRQTITLSRLRSAAGRARR